VRQLYYNTSGLPRAVWVVQIGVFLNYLGWGSVMPFEVLYLHDARGFGLGFAGLVVGIVTGAAVVSAPIGGPLIDRFGARVAAAAAGLFLAAGYVGLAFAHRPYQAIVAAAAAGIGNGGLIPSQSTLIAALVAPELRHRASAVSRVASNLGAAVGAAFGGAIAAHGLHGFVALFLANGVTYVLYVAVLLAAVREEVRFEPLPGGYRLVLRDRAFVRLAAINVGVIAVGWGVFTWIVPVYAHDVLRLGTRVIGLLLFANAFTVAMTQIPVARLAEGKRRTMTMATGSLLFAGASLLVVGASSLTFGLACAAVLVAAVVVGVGECFHTTALMPLVADLAPPALRGRYMAAVGLSWWLGLALAPTLWAQLLSMSPAAAMSSAAGVALAAAVGALALERELPAAIRLTPRPADG
jgi:MFS family permease